MENIYSIIQLLQQLEVKSTSTEEYWNRITMKGSSTPDTLQIIQQINHAIKIKELPLNLQIRINNSSTSDEDLELYISSGTSRNWQITLYKDELLKSDEFGILFFLNKESFTTFTNEKLKIFSSECPFHKNEKVVCLVNGLDFKFGGPCLQFLPFDEDQEIKFNNNEFNFIPSHSKLQGYTHIISTDDVIIDAQKFLITEVENDQDELTLKYATFSTKILGSTLVDEFYSEFKCTISGIKRLELKLYENWVDNSSIPFLKLLTKTINWVFEEKIETRRKLLIDRITLDIEKDDNLIVSLQKNLKSAYKQAKEHYNFVILDRKDEYFKELKDLLSDLKKQSDLYATKIRSLLSNLLRDILAAILLVGFSALVKLSENENLIQNKFTAYIFKILAIYYFVSIVLQTIVNISDIQNSKNEMLYWKKITRNYIPKDEFYTHIKDSLSGRRRSINSIYTLIAFVYLTIITSCWFYIDIVIYFTKPTMN